MCSLDLHSLVISGATLHDCSPLHVLYMYKQEHITAVECCSAGTADLVSERLRSPASGSSVNMVKLSQQLAWRPTWLIDECQVSVTHYEK